MILGRIIPYRPGSLHYTQSTHTCMHTSGQGSDGIGLSTWGSTPTLPASSSKKGLLHKIPSKMVGVLQPHKGKPLVGGQCPLELDHSPLGRSRARSAPGRPAQRPFPSALCFVNSNSHQPYVCKSSSRSPCRILYKQRRRLLPKSPLDWLVALAPASTPHISLQSPRFMCGGRPEGSAPCFRAGTQTKV